jgi:hypothetical protein
MPRSSLSLLPLSLALAGLWASELSAQARAGSVTLEATATVQVGLNVSCSASAVAFGTVQRASSSATGTITLEAAPGGSATATTGLLVANAAPAQCTVSGLTEGSPPTATLALSGGGGSAEGSGWRVNLTLDGGSDTLSALLEATFVPQEGNSQGGLIFVGGELSVTNQATAGNGSYASGPITLTVTD